MRNSDTVNLGALKHLVDSGIQKSQKKGVQTAIIEIQNRLGKMTTTATVENFLNSSIIQEDVKTMILELIQMQQNGTQATDETHFETAESIISIDDAITVNLLVQWILQEIEKTESNIELYQPLFSLLSQIRNGRKEIPLREIAQKIKEGDWSDDQKDAVMIALTESITQDEGERIEYDGLLMMAIDC